MEALAGIMMRPVLGQGARRAMGRLADLLRAGIAEAAEPGKL
jgi:hypothetical protein